MPTPWIIVGRLVLAITLALLVATPFFVLWLVRERRRALADFKRRRDGISPPLRRA